MVRGQAANTRVTVDLGSAALHRRVKVLAAYQGRPLREIVVEALKDWLEKQEELRTCRPLLRWSTSRSFPSGRPDKSGLNEP